MAKVELEKRLTPELADSYREQWEGLTLLDCFERAVAERGRENTAVVDGLGTRLTWGEVEEQARRVAGRLIQLGVGPGHIVTYQLGSRAEVNVLDLGILMAGAVVCPIPYMFRASEVRHILRVTRAAVHITQDRFRSTNYHQLLAEIRGDTPDLEHVFVFGEPGEHHPFADLLSGPAATIDQLAGLRPGPEDVAVIIFSSGTTGIPKGIMHTHNTVLQGCRGWREVCRLERGDPVLAVAPVGTAPATCSGVWLATYLGSAAAWLPVWDPEEALKLVESEGIAFIDGPVAFPLGMLRHPNRHKYDISSLKVFPCGGAPIPRQLFMESTEAGFKMQSMLGSVEALWAIMHAYDDPMEKVLTSEGRPIMGTEVRVIDDDGTDVGPGVTGELLFRGPMLTVGYFASPEQNTASFDGEGWWHSGDLVRRDEDGYIAIVGRKKDIIIRKGLKVDPIEIENLLFAHPKVQGAALVGVPDEEAGEKVGAFVVPTDMGDPPQLAELVAYLLDAGVAKYKLPERLDLVKEFPLGPTGKVLKYVLREELGKKLAQEAETA